MPAAQQQAAAALTRTQVCELLSKSPRTVAQYCASGRLPVSYVSGPNGREARFAPADVERLKREIETPVVRAVVPPRLNGDESGNPIMERPTEESEPPTALTRVLSSDDQWRLLAALLRAPAPAAAAPRPWLTLDEAAAWSGLTRKWLLCEAETERTGRIGIRDMGKYARGGRWRFRREDLARE